MGTIRREIFGTCDGGDCDRLAVSLAYHPTEGLIPVCRRHITAYRVLRGSRWQAEDEYAELQFCRRSRWRWLAQRRLLRDQRIARSGRTSRAQRRLATRRAAAR
jgi:hypothetical protein